MNPFGVSARSTGVCSLDAERLKAAEAGLELRLAVDVVAPLIEKLLGEEDRLKWEGLGSEFEMLEFSLPKYPESFPSKGNFPSRFKTKLRYKSKIMLSSKFNVQARSMFIKHTVL